MNRRGFLQSGAMVAGGSAASKFIPAVFLPVPLTWTKEFVMESVHEYANDPTPRRVLTTVRHRSDGRMYFSNNTIMDNPEQNLEREKNNVWLWSMFLAQEPETIAFSGEEFVETCESNLRRLNGTVVSFDDGFKKALHQKYKTSA